jgi:hypothetical protein
MVYTDDTSKQGWYPRGIADYADPVMLDQAFKHPSDTNVKIRDHHGPFPCTDKGHRDEWVSQVSESKYIISKLYHSERIYSVL